MGDGKKGEVKGSGNKIDNVRGALVKDSEGQPLSIYPTKPQGPYAIQEFPAKPTPHGFSDIVDNYAGNSTSFKLPDGATLYQVSGSLNGAVGRFEWIVDHKLGGVSHRMFVPNGTINGKVSKP